MASINFIPRYWKIKRNFLTILPKIICMLKTMKSCTISKSRKSFERIMSFDPKRISEVITAS